MIRKSKSTKVLTGFFCLPTSARAHVAEPQRSSAYKEGQTAYVLTATQSEEEGGYPASVVLYADGLNPLDFSIGQEIETQHAQVRKNLPPRRVSCMVFPDGTFEGEMPPKGLGLPHWEYISLNDEGGASQTDINAVEARIVENKANAEKAKEAARQAKKGSTTKAA